MRPLRPGLLVLALAWSAFAAAELPAAGSREGANATAPDTCDRAVLPAPASPSAAEALTRALPRCQRDAGFLAQLGQILLQQQRYTEAAEHLERALLLNPDLKGAKVDYAIALAGVGDILSAGTLIDLLLADADLPPGLRDNLQATRVAWRPTTGWQKRFAVSGRIGHDSNLAGTPNLSSLTLTFPEGAITLPLADSTLVARGGTYIRSDAQLDLRRFNDDGSRWDIVGSLRDRRSTDADNVSSSLADINIEHSRYHASPSGTPAGGGHYLAASLSGLRAQPGTRYAATGLAAGWGKTWTDGWPRGCQARGGGEFQHRRHISNGLLSGRYAGVAATFTCDTEGGSQWLVSARHGREMAISPARPGGDQTQSSLRGAAYWNLPSVWRGTVMVDVEAGRFRDERGYSPLFDLNRIRMIDRTVARIEYQTRVGKDIYWMVGAERLQQRSSLELFRLRSHGPYTSLRIAW